jgi:hypothetical protein
MQMRISYLCSSEFIRGSFLVPAGGWAKSSTVLFFSGGLRTNAVSVENDDLPQIRDLRSRLECRARTTGH